MIVRRSPDGGAHSGDLDVVERFAHHSHLTVVDSNARKRRVLLTGSVDDFSNAFGTELARYESEQTGHTFRCRSGALTIPQELQDCVVAVLGLDTRPLAKPHFRKARAVEVAFTPIEVATLYDFPKDIFGAGQTIAIIELGGGYTTADLTAYFKGLNVPMPKVTAVSVDGGKNTPGSDADGEVLLDIEIAGAIAYQANIAVYFAPNTDQGFVDAITDAVHDTARKPSVISISWGASEDAWTDQARAAMNAALEDAAALGVTVTAASGDNGSTDGETDGKLHVDFPASSPYALACGGTALYGSGNKISSEVVWNETAKNNGATGGGVSGAFALPSYQNSARVPPQPQTNFAGRGVPDVSGDADPATGYKVRVNGQDQVYGGTSAVAPLWAALIALLNQKLGAPIGFLQPKLYSLPPAAFRDITSGNNDDGGHGNYSARSGWDACTGLGSPNGAALLSALSPAQRTEIPGSATKPNIAGNWSPADPNRQIAATIVLRRAPQAAAVGQQILSGNFAPASRTAAEQELAAQPEDLAAIEAFVQAAGLSVTSENPGARTVQVEGTVAQMSAAFGISIGSVTDASGNPHLTYRGEISVPLELKGIVTAVLGLDQRPVAQHRGATAR
ncbi:MAG TPA: protease pro-enzyme activation domain-containing protein [Bryobacteraceae bacterium]